MNNKIVLIDDTPESLELLKLILENVGHADVSAFNDPEIALDSILDGEKPDLVITDYQMPGMTGIDLLEKIMNKFGNIKAIIITSEPNKVKFRGKEYPLVEKGVGMADRLLECIENMLSG